MFGGVFHTWDFAIRILVVPSVLRRSCKLIETNWIQVGGGKNTHTWALVFPLTVIAWVQFARSLQDGDILLLVSLLHLWEQFCKDKLPHIKCLVALKYGP